jgi:hypothetical protein
MSVVTSALCRHGMRTLFHVDDLLIVCSSFEEASREPQIIEDTLLAADIVRDPLKSCFDTPTQTLTDHLSIQESSSCRLRPPSVFREGKHLLLVSSPPGSFSSQRSLQHTREVQSEIVPVSNNRRQPALLTQLLDQESREPSRAMVRSTIDCVLHRRIGHHRMGLSVGATPRANEIHRRMVVFTRSTGNDRVQ